VGSECVLAVQLGRWSGDGLFVGAACNQIKELADNVIMHTVPDIYTHIIIHTYKYMYILPYPYGTYKKMDRLDLKFIKSVITYH
jgi:hypothetical protein